MVNWLRPDIPNGDITQYDVMWKEETGNQQCTVSLKPIPETPVSMM